MKKASLCAVIGTAIFVILQLLTFLINSERWGSDTVQTIVTVMQLSYLVGWALIFYFFYSLYRKQ